MVSNEETTVADLLRQLDTRRSVRVVDAAGRAWHVLRFPVVPNDYVPVLCLSCKHPGYSHGEDGGTCWAQTDDDLLCTCPGWTEVTA